MCWRPRARRRRRTCCGGWARAGACSAACWRGRCAGRRASRHCAAASTAPSWPAWSAPTPAPTTPAGCARGTTASATPPSGNDCCTVIRRTCL
ncbi:Protein of unknown function [Gryllus bimaculatus]|nr:Protein of unknown function [Gryllus bimaculatus]